MIDSGCMFSVELSDEIAPQVKLTGATIAKMFAICADPQEEDLLTTQQSMLEKTGRPRHGLVSTYLVT